MLKNFIGREKELIALEKEYKKDRLGFSVIYGRRRIGKSFLLRKFIEGKKAVYFQASESTLSNLNDLAKAISKELFFSSPISFNSYTDALNAIFSYSGKDKLVFAIDEISYIVQKEEPAFISILQRFVDINDEKDNIMLIITSSNSSFIEKEVISSNGPLFQRSLSIIELKSFSLDESVRFLPLQWSLNEKIAAHAITGGVAFYLKALSEEESFNSAVENVIFSRFGGLYNEVRIILSSTFRAYSTYDKILYLLSHGISSVTEIADKAKIDKANVSAVLEKLNSIGIIEKEKNILKKVKRERWKVKDNYFFFYYKLVFTEIINIENDMPLYYKDIEKDVNIFVSKAIEKDFIRFVVTHSKKRVEASGYGEFANPETRQNEEIDLVIRYMDGSYSFGECKWRNEALDMSVLNALKRKASLVTKESYDIYLLSKSGFTESVLKEAEKDPSLHLISPSSLSSPL